MWVTQRKADVHMQERSKGYSRQQERNSQKQEGFARRLVVAVLFDDVDPDSDRSAVVRTVDLFREADRELRRKQLKNDITGVLLQLNDFDKKSEFAAENGHAVASRIRVHGTFWSPEGDFWLQPNPVESTLKDTEQIQSLLSTV
uniref:RusA family crossover junction endodeoxyribonuclease n=1 Tax=Steinernema glaseri TaxID=37863 RepID=A0A1I7ZWR2_9BILA